MKIAINPGNEVHDLDNEEAKIVLMYKGHGMECQKIDLLDDHIEIDCARTLEYAHKYITMEEQIDLFNRSSIHRKCFDILWNGGFATGDPNKQQEPPKDLAEFKQSGSGMQHSIVLIMLMINAFARAQLTGQKVYLRNHPESHLHPAVQANLADLVIKFTITGFQSKQDEFDFEE